MRSKILWGASFANTWLFPSVVDNPMPTQPLIGRTTVSKGGHRDTWEDRPDDMILRCEVPLIPRLTKGSVTGYSVASTGVREALAWLSRGGNFGRFYVDADDDPFHTFELIDFDFERHVRRSFGGARYTVSLTMRDVNGTPWSEY